MKKDLVITQEWDKVFPKSDEVNHRKVTFLNRYGITLVADLYSPNCRGVWLDRGELEKLMAAATEEGRASAAPPAQAASQPYPPQAAPQPWGQQPQQGYREPPRHRDDRYRDDDYKYRKKKRDSIFDIFD
jgi:Zn-finger nucleic acid-binding protein